MLTRRREIPDRSIPVPLTVPPPPTPLDSVEILVNRGWVPTKLASPDTREEGQIEGEHEIIGVVRRTEKRSQFMPADSTSKKNMYLYR